MLQHSSLQPAWESCVRSFTSAQFSWLKCPYINHLFDTISVFYDFCLMYFRCYDILIRSHPEKLVSGLLLRLNSVDENIRVSTLIVFRHLMNSSMEVLQPRMSDIFSALHSKLAETSNRVRKMLAQLTVSTMEPWYFVTKIVLTYCEKKVF